MEELRAVKDEGEVERIAAAAELTDEVYRWAIDRGLAGRTEREVARACEARIRELGAEPSFPPIVAAGPNGALPHAEPGPREIGAGELVVFDMGAELDGYCSDCTRTFATGDPGTEASEIYELVRQAQAAALEALRPGLSGREADAVARELIEAAGHGERFGHGLGHGVGIEVHEAPRLAASSEDQVRAGNVVTVEPGVYLPGKLGVRIEDLVVVGEDGIRNLSGLDKESHGRRLGAVEDCSRYRVSDQRIAAACRSSPRWGLIAEPKPEPRTNGGPLTNGSSVAEQAAALDGVAGGDARRGAPRAPARHGGPPQALPADHLRDPRARRCWGSAPASAGGG